MHSEKNLTSELLHHTSSNYSTNQNQIGTSSITMMSMSKQEETTQILAQLPNIKTNHNRVNKITNNINITTHNIRGMSQPLKIQNWLKYCAKSNFHIIAITETKLTNNRSKNLSNPLYFIYSSNFVPYTSQQRDASLGTAIMVCKELQPYIHNIDTLPGSAIYIDFDFPSNKSRIISVYMPSQANHPNLHKKTQEKVFAWFLEAKNKNWNTIILGDFNANQSRNKNFKLFQDLNLANATSLLSFYDINDPTWYGPNSASQIDDIWCNSEITLDIENIELIDAAHITDSDHRIVTASWNIDISKHKTIRNKKKKRKIYYYEKMTKENWDDFASEANDYAWNITDTGNWDQTTLNKTWNKWATVIRQITNNHIPFSFKTSKPFYAFSLKSTHLHLALKTINKCLRQLTNKSSPPTTDAIDQYNKLLLKTANLAKMVIEPLTPTNLISTLTQTITNLKQIKHTIWTARNLEKFQEQNKRINSYINRRYDDFKDNTSRMLDSILQRRSEPIKTDKSILSDQVITEKQEVKEHIRRHFKLWTKTNPPNTNWQAEWEEIYHPIKKINPTIYEPVSEPITMEELQQTISLTPKNKANGPLPISNEILQHLPTSALDILLSIFNNSLKLNCVPDKWLQANVWPIPQKKTYNYDLNTTRLITLIDHTRKLFTKIISNRLTTAIMRYEVLSPMNFAAFPHQFTVQPVTQLTQMIEDANTNGKEIWALSQDMSKAFDSVNITTLEKALQRIKIPLPIIKLIIYILSH